MATRFLRNDSDPILRKKCKAVLEVNDKIRQLLDDMLDTLHETENGAALAANQVGILKRFPKRFVKTIRPQKVTIQARNEYGEEIIVDGEKEFYEQGYYDVRRMWFWKDYLRQEKRTGRIYPTFH